MPHRVGKTRWGRCRLRAWRAWTSPCSREPSRGPRRVAGRPRLGPRAAPWVRRVNAWNVPGLAVRPCAFEDAFDVSWIPSLGARGPHRLPGERRDAVGSLRPGRHGSLESPSPAVSSAMRGALFTGDAERARTPVQSGRRGRPVSPVRNISAAHLWFSRRRAPRVLDSGRPLPGSRADSRQSELCA